jgi:hypothetical protein
MHHITNYNLTPSKVRLGVPKVRITEVATKDDTNSKTKRTYINYNLEYIYESTKQNKLEFITHFSKIERRPRIEKNKILFDLNLNQISFNNVNFNNFVSRIINFVKQEIPKLHANITSEDICTPNTENRDGENLVYLKLLSFNNKIITPVTIHQSKKYGGKVICIKNSDARETLEKIKNEMPSFKFPDYGKDTKLYYEGKFCIFPVVEILEVNVGDKKKVYCNLVFYVKKMEVKYNVSNVISIFETTTYIQQKSKLNLEI